MERVSTISRTDLARRTRQVMERVRRGDTLIVESYGEEQVALLDAVDYRLLRAVAAFHAVPLNTAAEPPPEPAGLPERQLTGLDTQARWNQVITAYLDGQVSLGRAAVLLNISRFELDERFRRLDIPRRSGPQTIKEARADVETALSSLD